MRVVNAITAALVGIVVATGVANVPFTWPTLAIGSGAVAAAGVLLAARRTGEKRYAATGAIYCLGLAGAIHYAGPFPAAYRESPLIALTALGAFSALLVAVVEAAGLVARRIASRYAEWLDDEVAERLAKLASSIGSVLGLAWTVLTIHEKAGRVAAVGVGGTATLLLDLVGVELPVALPLLPEPVDVVLVLFVGCTLVGFHTLDALHRSWRTSKAAAKQGAAAGSAGASAAKGTVGAAREDH